MSKFEKGGYVREKNGTIGKVLDVEGESLCVCGGENRYIYGAENFTPISAKEAFLIRLQSLLREFDAEIRDYEEYMVQVVFSKGEGGYISWDLTGKTYEDACVNAENIMDYEEE